MSSWLRERTMIVSM